MELTKWQAEFREYFQSQFGVGIENLHPHIQTIQCGNVFSIPAIRWDTREYPWPVFERFVRELPSNVQVWVNQRVEVTKYNMQGYMTAAGWESDFNCEAEVTTSFVFYEKGYATKA